MVTVHVRKCGDEYVSLSIEGHADSNRRGKDLVCAGVSCIGCGMLNALDQLAQDACELEGMNPIRVHVLHNSETVQTILKTTIIQLETMEYKYSKFIQIIKQEV